MGRSEGPGKTARSRGAGTKGSCGRQGGAEKRTKAGQEHPKTGGEAKHGPPSISRPSAHPATALGS
eukprot:1958042-Pyramimonas_sp.AAC.1